MTGVQTCALPIYFTAGPNYTGWAIDGPYVPSANAKPKGPYFNYGGAPLAVPYQLADAFGTPYAYFASSVGGKYYSTGWDYTNSEGLLTTVRPYLNIGSSDKFVNSDSVQIISAGANGSKKDGGFGPGGRTIALVSKWKPGSGSYEDGFAPIFPGATGNDGSGADDMANFYGGKQLGAE